MIVIPKGIEFSEWANTLYVDLPTLNLPLAKDEDSWREWAETLILDNELSNIPLPENFSDWRTWAEYSVPYFVNSI